jgi:excisionase family DNA binding protein
MSMDTKERTAQRRTEAVKNIESLRLYTLTELEAILGVTHRTLQTYMKNGKLHGVKIGGKWKVSEESLRSFVGE